MNEIEMKRTEYQADWYIDHYGEVVIVAEYGSIFLTPKDIEDIASALGVNNEA